MHSKNAHRTKGKPDSTFEAYMKVRAVMEELQCGKRLMEALAQYTGVRSRNGTLDSKTAKLATRISDHLMADFNRQSEWCSRAFEKVIVLTIEETQPVKKPVRRMPWRPDREEAAKKKGRGRGPSASPVRK